MSYTPARAGGIVPFPTDTDLTQGQLVKIASGKAVVCGASDTPIGVVTDDADAGTNASVAVTGAVAGTVYIQASAAGISAGDTLKPGANGVGVKAATGLIVATALEASTGAGHLIECALQTPVTKS